MDRRSFVSAGALSTACAMTSAAASKARASEDTKQAGHPSPKSEALLQLLLEGNERFIAGKSKHPRMTEGWLRRLTKGQHPFVTILACSDSRVPLELLFDQGFGDIFAIRIAGNVVSRYGIGSIEYAQHHLHTPLFMVLGHEGCGAVTARLLPEEKRKQEPAGVRELLDLVEVGDLEQGLSEQDRLRKAVENNVRNSCKELMTLDPDEEGFQLQKEGLMVAAVYEISTGRVRVIDKYHRPLGAKSD